MANFISWLITPNKEINYQVITAMYGVCCCVFVLFYSLEFFLVSKENENFDSIKGVYIIFTPFFPALLWSTLMWKKSAVKKKKE